MDREEQKKYKELVVTIEMNGRKSARRRKLSPLPKLKITPAKSTQTIEFLKSPIKKFTNVSPKVDNKGIKIQRSPKLIKIEKPLPNLDAVKPKINSTTKKPQVVKKLTDELEKTSPEECESDNTSVLTKQESSQSVTSSTYFVFLEKSEPASDLVTEKIYTKTDNFESSSISSEERDVESDVKCPEIKFVGEDGENIVENVSLVGGDILTDLHNEETENSSIQKRVSFQNNMENTTKFDDNSVTKLDSVAKELHNNETEEKLNNMILDNHTDVDVDVVGETDSLHTDVKDDFDGNVQSTNSILQEDIVKNYKFYGDDRDNSEDESSKDSLDGDVTHYVNYPHDLRPSYRLPQRMSSRRSTTLIYGSLCCGMCQTLDTDTWEDLDKNRGCWAWLSNKLG